jgi:prolyl-tRNA synthetase
LKLSRLFGQRLHQAPADVEAESHALLLRAGFIRPLGAGIFSYLLPARRAFDRIEAVIREEMNAIGGQEISMPVIHPAEIWQATGRWYQIGSEMGRFKDKNDRDMVLAMTHEEVVAQLVLSEIHSYRQMPALVYQLQTKWRDDPRPRAGLIRVREFTMLDSYSLDVDTAGLEKQYQAHYDAYFRIFERLGLPVVAVQSDTGMMGGKMAHEYMYLTPIGEDTLLFCDACHYAANRQVARFTRPQARREELKPLEKVATPHSETIADVAAYLGVDASQTAKAVFFSALTGEDPGEWQLLFAVVRGDMEVNETKLANAVHARDLRPATDDEIKAVGAVPGYASPIGLKGVQVVVDELIPLSPNLVAGANEAGYHLRNVNYGRDFSASLVTDIVAAGAGYACPTCGEPMRISRGVEVGNIFQLGTRYTEVLGATFLDENGTAQPVVMGSYGIGVGRLLACLAEEYHDERGLCLPASSAPWSVHIVVLAGRGGTEVEQVASQVENDLVAAGVEPLVDDRVESAGVKFAEADLIGAPLRLTISERSLKQGGVEFKRRTGGDPWIVPVEACVAEAINTIHS